MLVDHLLVKFRLALGVVNIPPKGLEERGYKHPSQLGLVELPPFVCRIVRLIFIVRLSLFLKRVGTYMVLWMRSKTYEKWK
jgi:hypothetical protein